MSKALLIIDVQNDYFLEGHFPLWQTLEVLGKIEQVIEKANERHIPIILVQHIADTTQGRAAFFKEGSAGVAIHPRVLESAPKATVVKKHFADSFYESELEEVLGNLVASELYICGMMTQNCITHTILSEAAQKYVIKLIPDCCTSVDETIHMMALKALATRVPFVSSNTVFQ